MVVGSCGRTLSGGSGGGGDGAPPSAKVPFAVDMLSAPGRLEDAVGLFVVGGLGVLTAKNRESVACAEDGVDGCRGVRAGVEGKLDREENLGRRAGGVVAVRGCRLGNAGGAVMTRGLAAG